MIKKKKSLKRKFSSQFFCYSNFIIVCFVQYYLQYRLTYLFKGVQSVKVIIISHRISFLQLFVSKMKKKSLFELLYNKQKIRPHIKTFTYKKNPNRRKNKDLTSMQWFQSSTINATKCFVINDHIMVSTIIESSLQSQNGYAAFTNW